VEANEADDSVEVSSNSEDDAYDPDPFHHWHVSDYISRDLTDESYVTHGTDHEDGNHDIYLASLSSQANNLGFGTPLHLQGGRQRFR
jgi:hypothetical protein